ncbi:MAG: hydantoinase/oxoprolinase family protein, partial [Clostridium butyricum]
SGSACKVKVEAYKDAVKSIWEELTVYKSDSVLRPDFYLCIGPRVMDFASGSDFEQMLMIMDVSVQMADPKEEILIIGAKNEI